MTSSASALRTALRTPGSLLVDLLVVAAVVSLIGGLIAYGEQFSAPFTQKVHISLSWRALPLYTFFSLCRGFAAYAVSLLFTLVFASAAAHSVRAERVMLPILDVLQSIPVLGFLPGLVLGMIALFPTREIGLEIACIIMIFTGQAWNMTFIVLRQPEGHPRAAPRGRDDEPAVALAHVPAAGASREHDRAGVELDDVDGGRLVLPHRERGVHAGRQGLPPAGRSARTWPRRSTPATCPPCSRRSRR